MKHFADYKCIITPWPRSDEKINLKGLPHNRVHYKDCAILGDLQERMQKKNWKLDNKDRVCLVK